MIEHSRDTIGAIQQRWQAIADVAVERQYAVQGAMWEPYGERGRARAVEDVNYHLSFLCEALRRDDVTVFADYLAWVKVLFAGLGFPDDAAPVTFACLREALAAVLPPEDAAVATRCVDEALTQMAQTPVTLPSYLDGDHPLQALARTYLHTLLQGDRQLAGRLVLEALDNGATVEEIYLEVFEPVQREIGRLWQMNKVTVAQEHYVTAATQLIMSQLYSRIFSTPRIGRTLVATCVSGELHELGARMVADLFEMAGWDTFYLGANTPARGVVDMLAARDADAMAISATIAVHVPAVEELIAAVRGNEQTRDVKVLVGGTPFNRIPNLWREVGADAYAPNAGLAVHVLSDLFDGRNGGTV